MAIATAIKTTTMMFARKPVHITARATRYPQTSVSTSPKRYASGKMTIAAGTENGPTAAILTARMFDATSVATKSDEIVSSSGLGVRDGEGCVMRAAQRRRSRREQTRPGALRGDVRDLGYPLPAHQGLTRRPRPGRPRVRPLRPRGCAASPDCAQPRRGPPDPGAVGVDRRVHDHRDGGPVGAPLRRRAAHLELALGPARLDGSAHRRGDRTAGPTDG